VDDDTIRQHIDLYVNDYSLDLGEEGKLAIKTLLELAHKRDLVPSLPAGLFFNE
jgi:1,4-dihydroxy-6-naphthoate synthase